MNKLFAAALLGATLLAGPAIAQVPANAPAPVRADADNDGAVTRAEAIAAAEARFAARDANHDGRLTGEERRPLRGGHGRHRGPGPAAMLARADANGDGVVTRDEAVAAADARFAARQAREDGNADRKPPRPMTQAQAREMALRFFDRADTNHDGRVDAKEREAMQLLARARMVDHKDAPGGE